MGHWLPAFIILFQSEEHARASEPGLIAVRRAKNARDLGDAVKQLGKAKHAAAVPLLAELWADCALEPVRSAAGHALRTIGTPEARRALLDLIEDSDHFSVYLAVAAAFNEDPATAFDSFSYNFNPGRVAQPGGAVIPNAVLATFAPNSFVAGRNGELTPQWADSRAPSWLRQDPRWVRLCVALRHDKQLGHIARTVLRYADPDLVGPALEEAQAREGPRVVRPTTKAPGDLSARYLRGEYGPVWNELRSHAALGGDLLEEARAVAKIACTRPTPAAARRTRSSFHFSGPIPFSPMRPMSCRLSTTCVSASAGRASQGLRAMRIGRTSASLCR